MKNVNVEQLAAALVETMASIDADASPNTQHRVRLNGKINVVDEWDLRQYIKQVWHAQKGSLFSERHISPCGKFRALVIESGVVMITTWGHNVKMGEYVRVNGMGGSYSHEYREVY